MSNFFEGKPQDNLENNEQQPFDTELVNNLVEDITYKLKKDSNISSPPEELKEITEKLLDPKVLTLVTREVLSHTRFNDNGVLVPTEKLKNIEEISEIEEQLFDEYFLTRLRENYPKLFPIVSDDMFKRSSLEHIYSAYFKTIYEATDFILRKKKDTKEEKLDCFKQFSSRK